MRWKGGRQNLSMRSGDFGRRIVCVRLLGKEVSVCSRLKKEEIVRLIARLGITTTRGGTTHSCYLRSRECDRDVDYSRVHPYAIRCHVVT